MEIAGTHIAQASSTGAMGMEAQRRAEEVVEESVAELIESVPDPDSTVGQTIDVTA